MTKDYSAYPALQDFLASLPENRLPPEILFITEDTIACDGGDDEVGHPRVYLTLNSKTGFVVCPYCGRIYVRDITKARTAAAH